MSEKQMITPQNNQHQWYEIRLKGHLDVQWANRFEILTITLEENGDTLLSGPLPDQAALHGILKKVRDFGLTLLSVNSLPSKEVRKP